MARKQARREPVESRTLEPIFRGCWECGRREHQLRMPLAQDGPQLPPGREEGEPQPRDAGAQILARGHSDMMTGGPRRARQRNERVQRADA